MKLNDNELRTLGALHKGHGLTRLSNFDKPEKRVAKLEAAGMIEGRKLTEAGKAALRAYYQECGLGTLADAV